MFSLKTLHRIWFLNVAVFDTIVQKKLVHVTTSVFVAFEIV